MPRTAGRAQEAGQVSTHVAAWIDDEPRDKRGGAAHGGLRWQTALLASLAAHAAITVLVLATARTHPHMAEPADPPSIELIFAAEPQSDTPPAEPDRGPELAAEPVPEPTSPAAVASAEPSPPALEPLPAPAALTEAPPVAEAPAVQEAPSEALPIPPMPSPRPPAVRAPATRPAATPAQPAPRPLAMLSPSPVAPLALAAPIAPAPEAPAIDNAWRNALGQWLAAHKRYPEAARRRSEAGRAQVRFVVAREGRVTSVELLSGTGSSMLDDAVLAMLNGASLPPFPATMPQPEMSVTIQIRYALTD